MRWWRCSDPKLSAEDIALGYKQLLEVERGWRDMKTHLEIHPVHHRAEHRIRAHVLICWLALLLIRVAETHDPTRTWRRTAKRSRPCNWASSPATPAPCTNAPSSPPTSATSSPASSYPNPHGSPG